MNDQQEKRIFKAAPLPFQGQKRNFLKQFKKALTEFRTEHHVNTVIDLFGGSGLLSHTVKMMYPDMRVIYNDYDDFHKRIEYVETTNNLLKAIRCYMVDVPKGQKVEPSMKYLILSLIRDAEKKGNKSITSLYPPLYCFPVSLRIIMQT